MEQKEFKAGQKVYSPLWEGWKEIDHIAAESIPLPIGLVDCSLYFTIDGRISESGPVLLFHNPVEVVEKKWEPKQGELCWFWDKGSNGALATMFKEIRENRYKTIGGTIWDYCSPFSEIPEHIKKLIK